MFLCVLSLVATTAQAYNFLYIDPTNGKPIGWEPGTTIHYYLDPGPLGRLTNDQAHTLLKEAMKIWENASPYANVPHFEFAGYLPEDVDGGNYQKYVSLGQCYTNDLASCPTQAQKDLQTVVVFDNDDSILEKELCRITQCSATSGARVISGSSQEPGYIVQGIQVFGGAFASSTATKVNAIIGVMTHELGHLLGLAHTSLNQQAYIEDKGELARYMPTMFAYDVGGTNLEKNMVTLNPDDIAGISNLYPSDNLVTQTGIIKGMILKSDGSPMMHVNVIARNVEDPLCEAYSFLAGRTCEAATQEACENDIDLVSDPGFIISGFPVGSYTLEVEEVADEDLAHTLAPGLVDPFISGDAEFWNEGDQSDESNTLSTVIDLMVGEIKEGVNIILNRSEVTSDRILYLPLDTFIAGPGTACPENPSINYAALVGINEDSQPVSTTNGGNGTTINPPSEDNPVTTTSNTHKTGSASQGGCSLIQSIPF